MIATASQIAEKMSKITKSAWPSILQQWSDDILDEAQERILNKESAGGDDIIDIIQEVKQQINS